MPLPDTIIAQIRRRRAEESKGPAGRLPTRRLPTRRLPKPAKWLHPNSMQREYRRQLRQYIDVLGQTVKDIILPQLETLVGQASMLRPDSSITTSSIKLDNFPKTIERLIEAATITFSRRKPDERQLARKAGKNVSDYNSKQFKKVVRSVTGVDALSREEWLESSLEVFTNQNARLIKNISDDSIDKVAGAINRGLASGASARSIGAEINKQLKVSKRRAEFIARDQVASLNGELTKLRQKNLGVQEYIWRTAGDGRVRSSHMALEGERRSWNDSPTPGSENGCRCTAEPDFTGILDQL